MKNSRRNRKNQRGFSLVELMIVIAIIALLIGVGIPAWQAMVKSGNETTAIQTMTTVRTCQNAYAGKHQGKFAPTFEELAKSGCIEADKFNGAEPLISGYVYSLKVTEPSGSTPAKFEIRAKPQVHGGVQGTGDRFFYTDSSLGTIKASDEGEATAQSPSI